MNSKGGIYTTLAAVLMLAVLGASMMQVMAMQDDVEVKVASSSLRDVRLAWINARYLADKAIGKVLYNAAIVECSTPTGVNVSEEIDIVLGNIGGVSCTATSATCSSGTECTLTLTCSSGNTSFEDTTSITKSVSAVSDTSNGTTTCTITVTDDDSGLVEISTTTTV